MEEHKGTGIAQSEGEAMRQHQVIKWLLIIIVIQAVLFVGSWAGFIWYESQFETVTSSESYEAEANDGGNAIINGSGSVNVDGQSKGD